MSLRGLPPTIEWLRSLRTEGFLLDHKTAYSRLDLSAWSPAGSPQTVLCVDDNETNRYVRGRILREAGFQVIEAANGMSALKAAAEAQPAVIVLDVRLPDLDGFEVCSRLKLDPVTQNIPVLHVSAVGELENDLPVAFEHESDGYLREPIAPATLVATTRSLIRNSEYRERLRRSEAVYRGLIEQAYEGVWVVDPSGRTQFANRRMAEMLKCSAPEQLAGRNAFDFVSDQEKDALKAQSRSGSPARAASVTRCG